MKRPWFLLFDIDQTLLDFHEAERRSLIKTLAKYGEELSPEQTERYSVINDVHWKRLERGEITRGRVKTERFRVFLLTLGREDLDAAQVCHDYEYGLEDEAVEIPGALDAVREMAARGEDRLFLVSNGTLHVQQSRMALSGLDRLVEGSFISEEIGAEKPSKEFFDRAFAQIPDYDPARDRERTVIIGDSLTSDILGGKNAGIRTVWVCPGADGAQGRAAAMAQAPADRRPDAVIADLSQLPEALAGMKEEN